MLYNKKIIALCLARIQDDASNEYVTALNKVVAPAGWDYFPDIYASEEGGE